MQEKLEEKEQELSRLKSELQQKSQLKEKNDRVSIKKEIDEAMVSPESETERS